MPFKFQGTFRQTQWRQLRNWLLNERRTVDARIRYINAELQRIGQITVFYQVTEDTIQNPDGTIEVIRNVSEKRSAFLVSPGSSLEALVQAYIMQGGNPCAISMFLEPDEVEFQTTEDPDEDPSVDQNELFNDKVVPSTPPDQPGYGVIGVQSGDSYGVGGIYRGGYTNTSKNAFQRIGRIINLSDANAKISGYVENARRWANQNIQELNLLESKIIKLMDLREQLIQERDELLVQACGGVVEELPEQPDPNRFHQGLHLSRVVAMFDGVFYQKNEEAVPDFTTVNLGDENNPTGLSVYDTLFPDSPDDDLFCSD